METLFKTLKFNGKAISLIMADGSWYVAVKPICELLNVDYIQQFKNLKTEDVLGGVLCKHTTHDSSGRRQEMVCLPERYIYGWLFSIKSDSSELKEYKLKCYDVLYNHFHGQLTFRYNVLCEKTETLSEIEALENKLKNSPEVQRLAELKAKRKNCDKTLSDWDTDLLVGQMRIELN
jgi:hypothetical protein